MKRTSRQKRPLVRRKRSSRNPEARAAWSAPEGTRSVLVRDGSIVRVGTSSMRVDAVRLHDVRPGPSLYSRSVADLDLVPVRGSKVQYWSLTDGGTLHQRSGRYTTAHHERAVPDGWKPLHVSHTTWAVEEF